MGGRGGEAVPAGRVTVHRALGRSFFTPTGSGRRRPLGVRQPCCEPWRLGVPTPLRTRVLLSPVPLRSSPSASPEPLGHPPGTGPFPAGADGTSCVGTEGRSGETGCGSPRQRGRIRLSQLAASCPRWGIVPSRSFPRVRAGSGRAPPCPQLSPGDERCCSPACPGRGGCWAERLLVPRSLAQPDALFLALLQMATCRGP